VPVFVEPGIGFFVFCPNTLSGCDTSHFPLDSIEFNLSTFAMKSIILLLFIAVLIQAAAAQIFIEESRFGGAGNSPGKFNQPLSIAVSPKEVLYVVDTGNHRLQLFDLQGNLQKTIGGFGFNIDQFDRPVDIWVQSLINIYVSDYNNERLQRYDGNMNYISSLASNTADAMEFQFLEVASCAVNSQKDLFLLDRGENKIIKINRHNQKERSFGAYEAGEGELEQPHQLDIRSQKFLVVSDVARKAVIQFDFFGNYSGKFESDDFKAPAGLAVSNQDEIFVADPVVRAVFYINPTADRIQQVGMALAQPLRKPQDVAVFERRIDDQTETRLFIIDDNEIIIGKFIRQ